MKVANQFCIGECVAIPNAATCDGNVKGWSKHDVMEGLLQYPERTQEPRSDNSVNHNEVVASGVLFGCLRQDSHNHPILLTRFGKIGWNCPFPNEMPEIVGV